MLSTTVGYAVGASGHIWRYDSGTWTELFNTAVSATTTWSARNLQGMGYASTDASALCIVGLTQTILCTSDGDTGTASPTFTTITDLGGYTGNLNDVFFVSSDDASGVRGFAVSGCSCSQQITSHQLIPQSDSHLAIAVFVKVRTNNTESHKHTR